MRALTKINEGFNQNQRGLYPKSMRALTKINEGFNQNQ